MSAVSSKQSSKNVSSLAAWDIENGQAMHIFLIVRENVNNYLPIYKYWYTIFPKQFSSLKFLNTILYLGHAYLISCFMDRWGGSDRVGQ